MMAGSLDSRALRNAQAPSLECRSVTKRYGAADGEITVLDDVCFSIARGEFVAIVGPSGSGKSTLLALLAGLDRPSAGQIFFEGRELGPMAEGELCRMRRGAIGFVFQNFQLIGNLSARDNVLLPLELNGVVDADARCRDELARVGLGARAKHYPGELSGGEQQRVALARAFAASPRVLFADEPTGSLDARTGESVLQLLLSLRALHGTTLVLVTHDPGVAARADRRFALTAGRLEELA